MTETEMKELCARLIHLTDTVAEAPKRICTLPLKERIAVGLLLNTNQLFPAGEFTILQAVEYLGADWLKVAIEAERATMMTME